MITTERAVAVIEQIKAMPVLSPSDEGFQEQGERIAALCGDYNTFQELDERPGRFDPGYASSEWYVQLRRARNSCKRFFEVLNA